MTSTQNNRLVLMFRALLLAGLLSGNAGSVAQELLLEFSAWDIPILPSPEQGENSQPIRLNAQLLSELQIGQTVDMQIAVAEFVPLRITHLGHYINGDMAIGAMGTEQYSDFRLTLTVGSNSLFGYVSAAEKRWQILARADANAYTGWVYQPLGPAGIGEANDYFIPQRQDGPQQQTRGILPGNPVLPLQITSASSGSNSDVVQNRSFITDSNFRIEQSFNPDPALPGDEITVTIKLSNLGASQLTALALDVFFILEDSSLRSSAANCVAQLSLSLQQVLHCELGNFQALEQKSISFVVQANSNSTGQLLSTAVVENVRDDQFINIVADVRTDTDQDGISDFNEALSGTDSMDANSVDFSISVIDVMALYSARAENLYPGAVETRINQLVSVANQIYRDSGVAIRLRPVHHRLVGYSDDVDMETALDDLINRSHPAFADLEKLRASYGADLVMLFRPLGDADDRCGLAPVGGFRTGGYFNAAIERVYAVSHIAIDCPLDIAVAHELGHNMGLTHSHVEDGYGGTFDFSTGYGLEGQFTTVMAYPGAFKTENRVARFSNPLATCLGFACGVSADAEFAADAVQSLNLVRQQIANYYPSVVPELTTRSVTSLSGATSAEILIAASKDAGRSYSSSFSPSDRVDMSATIRVDERHVGQAGSLHVLVGEQGGDLLYQLNERGELELWQGDIASLRAIGGPRTLMLEERLSLLNDFQFGASLVGLNLVVYVGYRVLSSDDFIYTDAPLPLSIISP